MQGPAVVESPAIFEPTIDVEPTVYKAIKTYQVKPGPVSGYMTYVTNEKGAVRGYGLWAPDEEQAGALLAKEAERLDWKRG